MCEKNGQLPHHQQILQISDFFLAGQKLYCANNSHRRVGRDIFFCLEIVQLKRFFCAEPIEAH